METATATLPNLPLAEFQFHFEAEQHIPYATLTGSLWHGVFGNALKEQVCLVPKAECRSCLFLHQCDYPFLFQGLKPLDALIMTKYESIPVPHVFKINQDLPQQSISPHQQISLSVVLIGRATEKTVVLIKAMALAGKKGVGKARTPLSLKQVIQKNHTLPHLIFAEGSFKPQSPAQSPNIPNAPDQIELIFKTPYRSANENNKVLDSRHLLMQIVRRVSLLQNFYTPQALEADFKQLKSQASKAIVTHTMQLSQDKRYSAKHKNTIDTSGLVGSIIIQLKEIESLWPYLYLGQWLNVGKNASFGYGSYEIISH